MSDIDRNTLLLTALQHNWRLAKFEEIQQLGFTLIYGIIVAGVLAFAGRATPSSYLVSLMMFLLFAVSVLGLLMTLKWSTGYINYIRAIDYIISLPEIRLIGYMALPLPYPQGKYKDGDKSSPLVTLFKKRNIYIGFYSIFSGLWLSYYVKSFIDIVVIITTICFAIIFGSVAAVYLTSMDKLLKNASPENAIYDEKK